MNKYKICAYAICKNEERFVDRWVDSVKEADIIIVLDTGSSDNTIKKLEKRGVLAYKMKINPFRFDFARNACLKYIPDYIDICVSSDLDDVIEAGWREKLENAWQNDTTRGLYLYNWSFNPDGTPAVQYTHQRIHSRQNFEWIYPTHEVLNYLGEGGEKQVFIEGMVYNHCPDSTKDRSFNLPLLELAVKENPNNSRNMHYLGREYMFNEKWDECILTLTKYLSFPDSTYIEERAASMRFIARAYKNKGDYIESKKWLHNSICEAIYLREPYIELAQLAYLEEDWLGMYYYANEALKIENKSFNYVNEKFAWDFNPYDIAALGCYHLGLFEKAIKFNEKAMELLPNDSRLMNNHKVYMDAT